MSKECGQDTLFFRSGSNASESLTTPVSAADRVEYELLFRSILAIKCASDPVLIASLWLMESRPVPTCAVCGFARTDSDSKTKFLRNLVVACLSLVIL